MGKESIQQKRLRIRPARVNLTYEVEDGGEMKMKELPFVVGVLADLGGKNKSAKDSKFVNIDRDNFNDVMARVKPKVSFKVENTLTAGDGKLSESLASRMGVSREESGTLIGVEMEFNHIKEFEPDEVVKKVKPLRELVEARKSLSDLLAKFQSSDELERLAREVLENPKVREELSAELGDKKEEING